MVWKFAGLFLANKTHPLIVIPLRFSACQPPGLTLRVSEHQKTNKHLHFSRRRAVNIGTLPKFRPSAPEKPHYL
jgi:hypothetical protein